MQGLGSVQNLYDFFFVLGFPIGLSPRTMQGLGSVQNLYDFFFVLYFSTTSPYAGTGTVGLRSEAPGDAYALSTVRRSP